MHSTPDQPEVVVRMRHAHRRARSALGVRAAPDGAEEWGWRGRTLGQPVTAPDGRAWLRVAASRAGQIARTFWDGSLEAEENLGATVPRPRLRTVHDWTARGWVYRAELYDHVAVRTVAAAPTLATDPGLPRSWWATLRAALATVGATPTRRCTTDQQYIDWSTHRFFGARVDTTATAWRTAHGDVHWANLCGPELRMFDWEGWGLAPAGYDAAMLHTYSLLVPETAARVRREFTVLASETGRTAELVTLAELLHSVALGGNHVLAEPLRARASRLLGHSIPLPSVNARGLLHGR